jgi:hypothetical protein
LILLFIFLWLAVGASAPQELDLVEHFKLVSNYSMSEEKQQTTVSRIDLDIINDDTPELFLSHSQGAGNAGQIWVVYSLNKDGIYSPFGKIGFHIFGFRASKKDSLFVVWSRWNAFSGQVIRYAIGSQGFLPGQKSNVLYQGSKEFSEEWSEIEKWQREATAAGKLRLSYTTMEELATGKAPVWRDIKTHEPVNDIGEIKGKVWATETEINQLKKVL